MLNLKKKILDRHNGSIYAYEMGYWEGSTTKSSYVDENGCTVTTTKWDYTCVSEPDEVFCTTGDRDVGSRTVTDC